jgi:AcrR family transcriptional regulator
MNEDVDRFTSKGQRSRKRIIDTAMTLIRNQGYAETTIQGICKEVGIAVGTFYHYFHSKDEVLLAYIDEENKDLMDFYNRQDKTSYGRALLAVADYYVDLYFFKSPNLISHVYSMLVFSTLDLGEINEFAYQQILLNLFTHGQESGEFTPDIPVASLCDLAMGEWYYLTSLWCKKPEALPLRSLVAERYQQLLKLVTTPGWKERYAGEER